eukprot:TRINITY_DN948_c0_g1_i1.p1 TRINITY_DN948_c0_g1~~TRINITY_DN948_c0_g1_i1.p1  ORF type:complete len:473 (-),score=169.00 TRINITY_DN948_c0_g1_i1:119-1537(-)
MAVTQRKPTEENGVSTVSKKENITEEGRKLDLKLDQEIVFEFGGPIGVTLMMIGFPLLMYYFWFSLYYHHGALFYPTSLAGVPAFFSQLNGYFWESAPPTLYGFKVFGIFSLFSAVMAAFMPGPIVEGMAIPHENGKKLKYICNGVSSWYLTLAVSVILHVTKVWRLTEIIDNFGTIMTAAITFGVVVTFITYFATVLFGKPHRMSGSLMYDIFMGAPLNPRIGPLDLKLWAEIRVPWVVLFYISLSCAVKQYETFGYVCYPQLFMVLAHLLYVNACQKGEECIPTTWDIFYEKWGFMLIFWNLAGVPFTYCISSLYLYFNGPFEYPVYFTVFCYALLLGSYYIWDTCNSQKNRFRMEERGTYFPRKTFPQFEFGHIKNPRHLTTKHGNRILTDGWYRYARKMHYTADLLMALCWGMITGVQSFLPYFYLVFFIAVLVHRVVRDNERCHKKYGKDWEAYVQTVPYIFVPYVF